MRTGRYGVPMPVSARRALVHGTDVRGLLVDGQTRCAHYAGPSDVVALQLACCPEHWACRECHDALAGHPGVPVPADDPDRRPALCGVCGHRMRAAEYLAARACPNCAAEFNPGCRLHRHLYFADGDGR